MNTLTVPADVLQTPLKGRRLGARTFVELARLPRLLVFLRHFG